MKCAVVTKNQNKNKNRTEEAENLTSYAVLSTHHKVLVDLKTPNNLGVSNRMKREKLNIPYFKMNFFF